MGRRFTLTADHVKLLRAAVVDWNGDEFGAPTIDPKRPYGNSDVDADLYKILDGGPWDRAYGIPASLSPREWHEVSGRYRAIHAETEVALQVVLAAGSFEPGDYIRSEFGHDWRRDDG